MTFIEALNHIEKTVQPVSGEFALPEAERILGFLLDLSRTELYLSRERILPSGVVKRVDEIVQRRLTDEPLAYILGSVYFYHREFAISSGVLIPRPDTEILVETILEHERGEACRFSDIGAGSGCIPAILTEKKAGWRCVAVDWSMRALAVAQHNCASRVNLVNADMLSAFKLHPFFDFIVSNPPYISSSDLSQLPRSVRDFEPPEALDGGGDGLDFHRTLAAGARQLLLPGGGIYCEIGYDQGDSVRAVFESHGWRSLTITRDNAGNPRVIRAIR